MAFSLGLLGFPAAQDSLIFSLGGLQPASGHGPPEADFGGWVYKFTKAGVRWLFKAADNYLLLTVFESGPGYFGVWKAK